MIIKIVLVIAIAGLFAISFYMELDNLENYQNNSSFVNDNNEEVKLNKLTAEEKRVIINKGTERAFTGKYTDHFKEGTYVCKQCDAPLYKSTDKFHSNCGWPSFDDEIPGAVKRVIDADGRRTEIICANCNGHLGHVFLGEGFTKKDTRHCVNSISLKFVSKEDEEKAKMENQKAYFAGGCFWGVEYYLEKAKGVKSVRSGYSGGTVNNPTYKEVCSGKSGHLEVVEVVYDSSKIKFKELAKLFFEIHDPTHVMRQGPDIGEQYQSAIFYTSDEQKKESEELIKILEDKGLNVATKLIKFEKFWAAEDYHQDYYEKNGKTPYCHKYTKRF